jgi:hypothetical protein
VAFHRWGSATNTKSIALLGGEKGVHLILEKIFPGVSYKSAPGRFRETRSTILDFENSLID